MICVCALNLDRQQNHIILSTVTECKLFSIILGVWASPNTQLDRFERIGHLLCSRAALGFLHSLHAQITRNLAKLKFLEDDLFKNSVENDQGFLGG